MTDLLFWADVETTGLNPYTGDKLLEIAVQITDPELNVLDGDGFHAIIRHRDPKAVREIADDYVKAMHDATGLWRKIELGIPTSTVDETLTDYLKHYAPKPRQARLAGNSVRLDFNFIEFYLPHVAQHLHYRVLDVSSLAFEAYNHRGVVPYEKRATHEAKSDIRESIEELKYIRGKLGY